MNTRRTVALLAGAMVVVAAGISIGAIPGRPTLTASPAVQKSFPPIAAPRATELPSEQLFRGDMMPNLGLGCSNGTGTTGGPNDWATKVTSMLTPPYGISITTYNIFSFNSGPTWDLVVWNNGAIPGTEVGRFALGAANGTTGNHTVNLLPGNLVIPLAAGQTWFFGLSQGTNTNGVRIGMDNNGSTPQVVFIRAPVCGAGQFTPVENLGFPGYWVHRITIDTAFVPVELMDFEIS